MRLLLTQDKTPTTPSYPTHTNPATTPPTPRESRLLICKCGKGFCVCVLTPRAGKLAS